MVGSEVAWKSGKQTVMGRVIEHNEPRLTVTITGLDRKGAYKEGQRASVHKDAVTVLRRADGSVPA